MKPTYEQLEQQVLDLAVQPANAESKCRELAADNERAMDSLKQADAAVKLAHEKFSALADENMALKSGHYNGMVLPETPSTDAFMAEVRAQESKRVYESILDNPAATDMVSLVDWLEQNANDSVAFAAQLRKGVVL
ncbi:hypothetical protein OA819_04380 [Citrobacter freundii]|uniref:hypothetical protein n=1 Tax=Citrobacter freundii TaxID=546 RepID=UPI0025CA2750|nr:hypothetical protein [Citrobacter freundii]MDN4237948.1 hypothetical protein [Citrobacter freundii]MDN4316913.1 hypothetical protein [Citrobacter freundii]